MLPFELILFQMKKKFTILTNFIPDEKKMLPSELFLFRMNKIFYHPNKKIRRIKNMASYFIVREQNMLPSDSELT